MRKLIGMLAVILLCAGCSAVQLNENTKQRVALVADGSSAVASRLPADHPAKVEAQAVADLANATSVKVIGVPDKRLLWSVDVAKKETTKIDKEFEASGGTLLWQVGLLVLILGRLLKYTGLDILPRGFLKTGVNTVINLIRKKGSNSDSSGTNRGSNIV